jgi:hypothetical protein
MMTARSMSYFTVCWGGCLDDWDGWIPYDHHQRHRRLLLLLSLSFRPFRQVDHQHDQSIMTWQRCLRTTTTRPQHMMMPRNDDD